MKRQMRLAACLLLLVVGLAACNLNQSQVTSTTVSGNPEVRIVSPLPNATYLEGVPVNIVANVSNAGADIDRVEVLVDGSRWHVIRPRRPIAELIGLDSVPDWV